MALVRETPAYEWELCRNIPRKNLKICNSLQKILFGLSNMSRARAVISTCVSEEMLAPLVLEHTTSHPWTPTRPGLPESGWHLLSDSKETDCKKRFQQNKTVISSKVYFILILEPSTLIIHSHHYSVLLSLRYKVLLFLSLAID